MADALYNLWGTHFSGAVSDHRSFVGRWCNYLFLQSFQRRVRPLALGTGATSVAPPHRRRRPPHCQRRRPLRPQPPARTHRLPSVGRRQRVGRARRGGHRRAGSVARERSERGRVLAGDSRNLGFEVRWPRRHDRASQAHPRARWLALLVACGPCLESESAASRERREGRASGA